MKTKRHPLVAIPLENFSYSEKLNTINLTVEPITQENQAYIIDKRLLDTLLSRVRNASFLEHRAEVKLIADDSSTYDELTERLEQFIYMNKVLNHPNIPIGEQPVGKQPEQDMASVAEAREYAQQ